VSNSCIDEFGIRDHFARQVSEGFAGLKVAAEIEEDSDDSKTRDNSFGAVRMPDVIAQIKFVIEEDFLEEDFHGDFWATTSRCSALLPEPMCFENSFEDSM
jgi:hypothetical protein